MGCWFWSILQKKTHGYQHQQTLRRRQTFGPKPSGDCSFGSLAAEIYLGGQLKSRSFGMFPHVLSCLPCLFCLTFACLCLLFDDMLFSWFFNSLYNFLPWLLQLWLCDCWDLYLRNFPAAAPLEVSMVTLTVGSEVWRGTWCDLWIAHGSHMTHLHVQSCKHYVAGVSYFE